MIPWIWVCHVRGFTVCRIYHFWKSIISEFHSEILASFCWNFRYWDVIDRALRTAAYDRGVQVRLLASNWTDTKPQMFPMLKSLQAFSKACKYGSVEVVSCPPSYLFTFLIFLLALILAYYLYNSCILLILTYLFHIHTCLHSLMMYWGGKT